MRPIAGGYTVMVVGHDPILGARIGWMVDVIGTPTGSRTKFWIEGPVTPGLARFGSMAKDCQSLAP
jgi:hypothetical protein